MVLEALKILPVAKPSQEQPLQASKWIYIRMLLDPKELQEFFHIMDSLWFLNISTVCQKDTIMSDMDQVMERYRRYIKALQGGAEGRADQKKLTWALSKTLDPFYLMALPQERCLVKVKTPVIRMQHFHFHYIFEQGSFILTHHVEQSISWGLEFSFPQFYQDPNTCLPIAIFKDLDNPNTQLFRKMQQWVRDHTVPATFLIEGVKKVAPFRLGKKCFQWIHSYPDLKNKGLAIHAHRNHHHWT